jgi:L,D-transpeptidase ErfK/SrfK
MTRIKVYIAVMLFLLSTPLFAKPFSINLCSNSDYICYSVKKGDTWEKLFPEEDLRDLIMRINRINIKLYPGLKIAIPRNGDVNPMDFSPLPRQINPPGDKLILVSMSDLAFGAYDAGGNLEHWGPISAGKGFCPDINRGCHTPAGKFEIYAKGSSSCASTKYPIGKGGAPMPYCMFFKGGFALHGSYILPGYHDSHGCVRMLIDDAQWLNQNFLIGQKNAIVIIK